MLSCKDVATALELTVKSKHSRTIDWVWFFAYKQRVKKIKFNPCSSKHYPDSCNFQSKPIKYLIVTNLAHKKKNNFIIFSALRAIQFQVVWPNRSCINPTQFSLKLFKTKMNYIWSLLPLVIQGNHLKFNRTTIWQHFNLATLISLSILAWQKGGNPSRLAVGCSPWCSLQMHNYGSVGGSPTITPSK